MPALGTLTPTQYDAFRQNVGVLIAADDQLGLFEWTVQRIVTRQALDAQQWTSCTGSGAVSNTGTGWATVCARVVDAGVGWPRVGDGGRPCVPRTDGTSSACYPHDSFPVEQCDFRTSRQGRR